MIREVLKRAESLLRQGGVDDPRIEAEVLLAHLLDMDRAQLYAGLDEAIPTEVEDDYDRLLERRAGGEPTAYITGHREFYGLDFYVDSMVLIPRPESELLVELALKHAATSEKCLIADVGTGSGALVVALAKHLPNAIVYATDVSAEAIEVAAINCRRHGVADRVKLPQGDLLEPVPEQVDIIVANPPYVNGDDMLCLPREIREHEPRVALDGGADGLDVVRRLLPQVEAVLKPGGAFFMEMGYDQASRVSKLVCEIFPDSNIELVKDLAGIDRVLAVYTPVASKHKTFAIAGVR